VDVKKNFLMVIILQGLRKGRTLNHEGITLDDDSYLFWKDHLEILLLIF
tara:strand:- start:1878 stop:2024 length:147 start_codon:yes stop_codon:yes gene_type:complete